MRRAAIAIVTLLRLLAPGVARAQDTLPAPPPTPAVVAGRVVIPSPQQETPVPGIFVTVHRVGQDSAGPLDSVRTDARGRYAVHYTRFGSEDALYFAAAVYNGIAYFTAPLRGERVEGDDAEITVFDTTSRPVTLTIQGHHIVVSAPNANGGREVVEVYELSNDTTATLVPRDSLTPVWSATLPADATDFTPGQGDVAASALTRRGNRVELFAPFGPGVKQLSFSYVLKDGAFPLNVVLERQTGVFEVLLEEQAAQARGPSLRAQGSVSTQGRTFKRFLAQGAPAGETIRIDVPTAAGATRVNVLIAVAVVTVLAMIGAFWRALSRRAPRIPGATGATMDAPATAESLVAAIAALDTRHDAGDTTLDEVHYSAERAALKARLADALAARDAGT
ncbi:MAG TPA: hypothetical protein VFY85_11845 [Gemmatimonadaceae bacterium]|nr:hypothetical protein [Gemmatimonadaceae bacterium]